MDFLWKKYYLILCHTKYYSVLVKQINAYTFIVYLI
jgi:hypothetical protein